MQGQVRAQDAPPASGAGQRRAMVFRAFLAQNVAIGCTFGGFGVSVMPLQQHYGASRGTATLALALSILVLGFISPFVGALIGRIGLRWTMIAGALLSALGYALMAVAPSMTVVLLIYALPIGIGLTMLGPFPASVLASNWYPHNPGPALGIANVPLFVALVPMIGQAVIRDHGLSAFYLMLAAIHLLVLPFLLGVSDGPAARTDAAGGGHGHVHPAMLSTRSVLARPVFWLMCLGAGYLSAVAIVGISHLVAFSAERGIAGQEAALLLSVMGGAAVIGALLVGILCGRLGPARAIALIAATQAISWLALSATTAFVPMAAAALFAGAASAGVFPAVNMLAARLFGQESLPRVVGLFGFVTLPMTFCLPPLAGVLRDAAGSYGPVVTCIVIGSGLATLLFLRMSRSTGHHAAPILAGEIAA